VLSGAQINYIGSRAASFSRRVCLCVGNFDSKYLGNLAVRSRGLCPIETLYIEESAWGASKIYCKW